MAKNFDKSLAAFQRTAGATKPLPKPVIVLTTLTREQWLLALTEHFRELFKRHGAEIPTKIRMSCGWPSNRALGKKKRVLGQCWPAHLSLDGTVELFISPYLSAVDTADGVGATLAHELCHAALPPKEGHGPLFRKLAVAIGLEGKMTATTAAPRLQYFIEQAAKEIGPYPHATLDLSKQPKQSTRLLKVECPSANCDFAQENERSYSVRMSASVFEFAAPRCGCCGKEMIEARSKKKKAA